MPLALWLTKLFSPRPEVVGRPVVVVDPFGGSGTFTLAARRLGRVGLYNDFTPKYVAIAATRLGAGPRSAEEPVLPVEPMSAVGVPVLAPPAEGAVPPVEVAEPPAEGSAPPVEVAEPPAEGSAPPVEVAAPPVEVVPRAVPLAVSERRVFALSPKEPPAVEDSSR